MERETNNQIDWSTNLTDLHPSSADAMSILASLGSNGKLTICLPKWVIFVNTVISGLDLDGLNW